MLKKTIRSNYIHNNTDPDSKVDINEIFIDACANGDTKTINEILNAIKDFNIDVTDNLGRTALRLAVANEHLEIVKILLSKSDSQKIREALLLAIFSGHTQIAECILQHPQYKVFNEKKFLNGATDSFWQTPSSDDAQFSPDITPIMLASQYNRTEIVQMLLLNGDRIEKPHDFYCKCTECGNRFKFDSLRHAQSRLNAYRGLASVSYISLASIDPLLTAFELGRELRILSEKEKYFKHEYLDLAETLSEYTVKLLGNVRGRDELDIVLNKIGKENDEKFKRLARLDLALKYREMPFVAHPNCQQKLVEIWQTGTRKILKMNPFVVSLLFIGFILFLPFACLTYVVLPKSKIGRFLCLPFIKFLTFTISYSAFILLVLIESLTYPSDIRNSELFSDLFSEYAAIYSNYSNNLNIAIRFPTPDFYVRSHNISYYDLVICVWLFGFLVDIIKKVVTNGLKDVIYSAQNLLTYMMIIIYGVSYAMKFYTIASVQVEYSRISDPSFWTRVAQLDPLDYDSQKSIYQTFYWLNADRFYWFSLDPIFFSDTLFAIALILTFSRLCFWLPANQTLGPLQITLGRMISDILKFICIFTILFSGFVFGLNALYWYYPENIRGAIEIAEHINLADASSPYSTMAGTSFGTISSTVITMFFALYTMGQSNDVLIQPFPNELTPIFGYMVFGMYHITNITILMSMLIAMMTKSFESIMSRSDIEWKYSRSVMYMEFIKDGATLPVPFNLIPTPTILVDCIGMVINRIKNRSCYSDDTSSDRNSFNDSGSKKVGRHGHHQSTEELSYKKVMDRVIKRFILHNNKDHEEIKESDFEEVKQDLQEIRLDMVNDIRKSRENLIHYISVLHKGIYLIGEHFFRENISSMDMSARYKEFKTFCSHFFEIEDAEDSTNNNNNNNNNNAIAIQKMIK